MQGKHKKTSNWLIGLALLIIIAGILTSLVLFRHPSAARYPALIADAYQDPQQHLTVPGDRDVKLTRTGAYGIYYEYSLVAHPVDPRTKMPPAIDCSLVSHSSGARIAAVPDYVETNRYRSREQDISGVLIMSITVDKPDTYSFACHYQDGRSGPEIVVTLGPNYFWEFLRVAWKIGIPLLSGVGGTLWVAPAGDGIPGVRAACQAIEPVSGPRVEDAFPRHYDWETDMINIENANETPDDQARQVPVLFAWLASAATVALIVTIQFLPRGGNPYLRGTGVLVLLLAGVFIFKPFYLLAKYGKPRAGGTNLQSRQVVDRGLYAITRHPQYLGYSLLASGFALLSQHWAAILLAVIGITCFYIQAGHEEEAYLVQFGEPYARYQRRVPRFNIVLGLWRVLLVKSSA